MCARTCARDAARVEAGEEVCVCVCAFARDAAREEAGEVEYLSLSLSTLSSGRRREGGREGGRERERERADAAGHGWREADRMKESELTQFHGRQWLAIWRYGDM